MNTNTNSFIHVIPEKSSEKKQKWNFVYLFSPIVHKVAIKYI